MHIGGEPTTARVYHFLLQNRIIILWHWQHWLPRHSSWITSNRPTMAPMAPYVCMSYIDRIIRLIYWQEIFSKILYATGCAVLCGYFSFMSKSEVEWNDRARNFLISHSNCLIVSEFEWFVTDFGSLPSMLPTRQGINFKFDDNLLSLISLHRTIHGADFLNDFRASIMSINIKSIWNSKHPQIRLTSSEAQSLLYIRHTFKIEVLPRIFSLHMWNTLGREVEDEGICSLLPEE